MPRREPRIDAYLAAAEPARAAALAKLRATIHGIQPSVEECISYGMPAFRVRGAVIAGFQATATGCSYYPFSGSTLATAADAIADYSQTKSALHFAPTRGLPKSLVRTLLATRIAELPAARKTALRSRRGRSTR